MRKVQSFSEINKESTRYAGGKGGALAQMYQNGYPVPNGFVVLTTAFNEAGLLPEAWDEVKENLTHLKQENAKAFAVRSSALSEDSGETSFAGEFETILGVKGEEEIREAIHTVWESRESERVKTYSEIHGLEGDHEIAVVVQSLVDSDYAGVLFTVDPVSGRAEMLGNYVLGLGEKLVSGEADAHHFTFKRPSGAYNGPKDIAGVSNQLYNIALRLEDEFNSPQDIEWAVADNTLYLLQSRPITTLNIHDPKKGYYNDTLLADYLWTNGGIGENLPGVMTPSTWSIWEIFFKDLLEWSIEGIPAVGNIAGRPYLNMSLVHGVAAKVYGEKRSKGLLEPSFGKMPEVTYPPIKVTFWNVLNIIPGEIRWQGNVKKFTKEIPEFIKTNPSICWSLIDTIRETETPGKLLTLWRDDVKPLFIRNSYMLKTINEHYNDPWMNLAKELKELVGKEEADLLMTTVGNTSEDLESLGVMDGVAKIANGELTREDYLQSNGHRFPYEWHLHVARPYENPEWLEDQIELYNQSPFDLDEIAENQRVKFDAAWARFQDKYTKKSKKVKKQLDNFATLSVEREHIRSEITRVVSVIRELYLKAGELTGLFEDIFLLTYQELESLLDGNEESLQYLRFRSENDARLRELPDYPSVISGTFNPFTWSKNPHRRVDYYDSHQTTFSEEDPSIITGNPGSGGVIEGIVRVVSSLEEAHELQQGEILVTSTTNIGWTPLFPRASAVITDIGMPLAHAAIVAREIGIPAVVGCGTATARLETGDRVEVDGDQGVIRLLESES